MNSFRPIPINLKINENDSNSHSSKSIDQLHQSWKIEKVINDKGKSNYKLISDNKSSSDNQLRKHRSKKHLLQQHKPIGAYGVPGSNAYMNTRASTLNSSIIKTVKKIRKSDTTIKPIQDISEMSVKTLKNNIEMNVERFAENEDSITKNMIIGNDQKLISYTNGNDLLHKSFYHGHLLSNNVLLQNLNLLISYFGNIIIPYMTISIWSQTLSPSIELINIISIPIQNIESNQGKFITKEIHADIISKGQLFFTINCPNQYNGKLSIKYNLEMTQITTTTKNSDLNFEFPSSQDINPPIIESTPPVLTNNINKNTFPILSKGIFPDLTSKKKVDNKKVDIKPKEIDRSTSINHSVYADQAKHAAIINSSIDQNNEDVDFTEKDDTDINKILNILRNQSCQN